MDKELERMAVMAGGRMLHNEQQHEVVCFRPDDFEAFCQTLLTAEREACAKVCDAVAVPYQAAGASVALECAEAIRARSNAMCTPDGASE